MIRRRADACVTYRPALVDFVEHRALGPESPAALDHLNRCARCEDDLSEVAQTVIALRRLGAQAGEVHAPADGWPTLRARIERSQRAADDAARRFRRAFGGAVFAMAVLAMVAIPSLTGTVTSGLNEGIEAVPAVRSSNTAEARRYDPYAQRLTEGIVLAIGGGGPARVSLAERVGSNPWSTDRQDPQRAALAVRFAPTTPRASDGVPNLTAGGIGPLAPAERRNASARAEAHLTRRRRLPHILHRLPRQMGRIGRSRARRERGSRIEGSRLWLSIQTHEEEKFG